MLSVNQNNRYKQDKKTPNIKPAPVPIAQSTFNATEQPSQQWYNCCGVTIEKEKGNLSIRPQNSFSIQVIETR